MTVYILRRILIGLPVLFLVVTLVFFAFQLIPGDAARMYAGDQAPLETVEQVRRELGLDRPVHEQYFSYLGRLARGDLGKSYITRRPVSVEVFPRFWNTAKLALVAIIMATVLGVLFGAISAVNQERFWDYLFSVVSLFGISIPVFWLALLLTYLLSIRLNLLPTAGNDSWQHYLMPAFSLAAYSIAFVTRMTRSSVLETMRQDYVRTARAKGLPEHVVLSRHILRNALVPIIAIIGLQLGYMLGGAVITETIFAWPGMGRLLVTAVAQRDIPIVQGVLLVSATAFVMVNLLVDTLYGLVDPQIRYD